MYEVGYMAHRQKMLHTPGLNYLPSWHFQHICGWIPSIYEIFDQITCLKINLVRRIINEQDKEKIQ